eukprot:TRINITY_DN10140_c0_g1_i3.p1 TRINITY_DN10140_c0_g1~~TRINITY_DN10140_c0_g1_i3.p1  ORF type:complete len:557 (-),score=100.07 TRINITY_DN10140_c0_g1_i3:75-1721(-)
MEEAKKKRGRPKGSTTKKPNESTIAADSPQTLIKPSAFAPRRSPRLNPNASAAAAAAADSLPNINFSMNTPVIGSWHSASKHHQDESSTNSFLPTSVDFNPAMPSNFLSPIVQMPKPATGGQSIAPPALTPDMSPNLFSHAQNNLLRNHLPLRRSPRFTPSQKGLTSAFSPTAFWRSPVPGMKSVGANGGLEEAPLEIPPGYFSGTFLDTEHPIPMGLAPSTTRIAKIGGYSPVQSPAAGNIISSLRSSAGKKSRKREEDAEPNNFMQQNAFLDYENADSGSEVEQNPLQPNFSGGHGAFKPRVTNLPNLLNAIHNANPADEDEVDESEIVLPKAKHSSRPLPRSEGSGALGSSCHQCKSRRTKFQLAHCNAGMIQHDGKKARVRRPCRKKYCAACLSKFYREKMPSSKESWQCPACRQLCSCAACRKGKMKLTSSGGGNRLMQQDPAMMSPATSIAVGLVHYGAFMNTSNAFEDISEELQQEARKAADHIVRTLSHLVYSRPPPPRYPHLESTFIMPPPPSSMASTSFSPTRPMLYSRDEDGYDMSE